jgi:protein phosphatase PTC7
VTDINYLFQKNNAQELRAVLIEAVKANKNIGSSTVVLAKFDTSRENYLKATNLGDSGYLLLRPIGDGKFTKLYRTTEQQFSFNFPYQCGTGAELPYAADDQEHEVQDNDIIVMATDGVFDNLYDDDVQACVALQMSGTHFASPTSASDCIASTARKLGYNTNYLSPFAKNAQASGLNYPSQGKADDISVVCAQIHTRGVYEMTTEQPVETNGPPTTSAFAENNDKPK